MNNEIKEMLEQMESIAIIGKDKNGIKVDGYGLQQNGLKILLEYITNLQQENERLKEEKDNLYLDNTMLKMEKDIYKKGYEDFKNLLNILQNGSDDNV